MATQTGPVSFPQHPPSPPALPTDPEDATIVSSHPSVPLKRHPHKPAHPPAPGPPPVAAGCKRHRFSLLHNSSLESYERSLPLFPSPELFFPSPTLDFDFRVAVKLRSEPSHVQSRGPGNICIGKDIAPVSSGQWSGTFGNGRVLTGGYDLAQARSLRPIRIIEGAFILQTTDDPCAILELRTRGSLSGSCDVLNTLLSCCQPKDIDPRKYVFRMFATIKSADKRYAEYVNCALWIGTGVWKGDELLVDAYRVT